MAWGILLIAGLLEVGWAVGLKWTHGFSRFWPSLCVIVAMASSLWLLAIAMRSLPVGTAYSVWVGIGAIGSVLLGIVVLDEPVSTGRLLSLVLIGIGILGVKMTTPA
ncbi:MAG: quaternary ammonium compound efflux SMR transporter SugE [Tahibacter sp.]